MPKLPQGFRKLESGKLEYRFTVSGVRASVYGASVRECRKKELAKRQQIIAGETARNNPTFEEYFNTWLERRAGKIKLSTAGKLQSNFNIVSEIEITPAHKFKDFKIRDIKKTDIETLYKKVRMINIVSTANSKLDFIKQVLDAAIIDEIITKNPARLIEKEKDNSTPARETIHRALTVEEQKAFFEAAKGNFYYNLFCFLIMTGCRIGEAAALLPGDIDKNMIHINKTMTRTEAGKTTGTPKTKTSKRDIPLTEQLKKVIAAQERFNIDLYGLEFEQKPLFRTPRGCMLEIFCVNRTIQKICASAGVERFSCHAFRDTFATRAIESGMNPKTLQEILGHATINMTMNLYAHVMENTKVEEMNNLVIAI